MSYNNSISVRKIPKQFENFNFKPYDELKINFSNETGLQYVDCMA